MTNSESDAAAASHKTPPKLKRSGSPAPSSTPPSFTVKTEAGLPDSSSGGRGGVYGGSPGRERTSVPGYPSPALTPGSEYPPGPPATASSFWSPITPPEGVEAGPPGGFDARHEKDGGSGSRAPPTLVQMQVSFGFSSQARWHLVSRFRDIY